MQNLGTTSYSLSRKINIYLNFFNIYCFISIWVVSFEIKIISIVVVLKCVFAKMRFFIFERLFLAGHHTSGVPRRVRPLPPTRFHLPDMGKLLSFRMSLLNHTESSQPSSLLGTFDICLSVARSSYLSWACRCVTAGKLPAVLGPRPGLLEASHVLHR